jgi:AraC family transcriptional regulator
MRSLHDDMFLGAGRNVTIHNQQGAAREIDSQTLLHSRVVTVRDVYCRGRCRTASTAEHARVTSLVFPYRGVYVRHLGQDQAIGEANQVLFFNAGEEYRVSHPVTGGDASLSLVLDPHLLEELTPPALLRARASALYRQQRLRIDARAQALVALLRHSLRENIAEPLEAEGAALTLVRRALGPRTAHAPAATAGQRLLVDRMKLVIAGNLARRWTLTEVAAEVRGSPVYLTQVFQQVEGMPLYRYHLRLRLARALDLLPQYDDLTALSLELGFSSHSHFTAAFREAYGCPPSEFRRTALRRRSPSAKNR